MSHKVGQQGGLNCLGREKSKSEAIFHFIFSCKQKSHLLMMLPPQLMSSESSTIVPTYAMNDAFSGWLPACLRTSTAVKMICNKNYISEDAFESQKKSESYSEHSNEIIEQSRSHSFMFKLSD
jgi:hypothetical protein